MRSFLLLVLLGALTACRTTTPSQALDASELPPPSASTATDTTGRTLGPGDLVDVRVFQEPDHSGVWAVSTEGTIDYPLCGKVHLAGRTSGTAADVLRGCLTRYLKHPEVSVVIREYNSKKIFVFGEVQKPGTFSYEEGMTIIEAVTLAGGLTKLASPNGTQVARQGEGQQLKIRVPVKDIRDGAEKNFPLQPGDIVFVPESLF
ncbi:polysaccharide biosynthesis/export family protein [Vitiosangium sp. GDMCC 1.1324]|uniref:polysaccharide biosynthesis/export family protein n=1 Tax=Vitiosangium sp. (strain GDMCC 1.1324) TaxID=2138576 RepID=UPI000D3C33D8|nr:polysaccharide biosynthesis/export family protein [Vitiosangium sp. GDMCC 1.1324]PTL79225.1 polysaccharide biosynthesis protein [Vitiosangium sp. GDMCC 1.1324]